MRDFLPAARVIITNHHHTVLLFQRRTSIDHNQPHQTTTTVMTQNRTIKNKDIKQQHHQNNAVQLIAHHSLCTHYKIQSFDPFIGVEVEVCVLVQTMSVNSNPFYDCGGADMPFLPPRLLPHLPPPPNLEVPHAHLKSIWECPKINKVSVELENGKSQAGWRCGWCQSGNQMFKTAHATKALAHVLSLPRCNIHACKGNISK
jgi:hypothetical protein